MSEWFFVFGLVSNRWYSLLLKGTRWTIWEVSGAVLKEHSSRIKGLWHTSGGLNICYAGREVKKKLFISLTWRLGHRVIQKHFVHVFVRVTQLRYIGTVELVAFDQVATHRHVHEIFKHNQTTDMLHGLQQDKNHLLFDFAQKSDVTVSTMQTMLQRLHWFATKLYAR